MNTKFSYTSRDLEAARKEGIAQLPIISNGRWTDMNPSDPGIIILDYVHALVDMIQYYQDHQALESYMVNARERRNIFKLARQMSYKVKSSVGASTTVDFYVDLPLENNVTIPVGTVVSATLKNKTLKFMTTEEVMLYAGQTQVSVNVKEGEVVTTTYVGTSISELSQSQDPRNQFVDLREEGIDMSTIQITDDSGFIWEEIDFIFFSEQDERRFEVEMTPDNKIRIKFGNGQRGRVPLTTDTLTISYVKTQGSAGNIGAKFIDNLMSTIRDDEGGVITLRVKNEQPTTGGADPQEDNDIKEHSPKALKTLWRAVTSSDFEVLAREIPGVASVKALDIKNSPEMCLHHEVKLVIVPTGGSTPSDLLKSEVFEYLYRRTIPPTVLQIIDPIYVDIDFSFTVGIDPRYMTEEVEYEVNKKLEKFFEDAGTQFGQIIRYTSLISLISSVNGVTFVSNFSMKEDIQLSKIEMARLGQVEISITREV